jgi:tetratricopeptide (TPR) repeat protein
MRFIALIVAALRFAAAGTLEDIRKTGAALEQQGHWSEAAAVYESALRDLGKDAPPSDRFWLVSSLAEISFECKDYGAARSWLHRALPSTEVERLRLLNASGTLRLVEGNLTAASRDLTMAVELAGSVGGPLDLAAALHNLAAVEMHSGRLDQAIAHERQALDLWRRALGDRHAYVFKAWVGLSSAEGVAGKWLEAQASIREALRIAETPEALANHAAVLEKLGRSREARDLRKRLPHPVAPVSNLIDVRSTEARIRTR